MPDRVVLFPPESGDYALKHGVHAMDAVWASEANGLDGVMAEIDGKCPPDVNVVLMDRYPCKDMRGSSLYQMFGFIRAPNNNS